MSKKLVLFFTDKDYDWDVIPDHSGSDRSPYEVPENRPEDEGCALVVFDDKPKGGFEDVETFLDKTELDWADEVYLAVHNHQQHHHIRHSKLVERSYHHEPEGDRIYGAFREVIESEAEDRSTEETGGALQKLVEAFNMNWLLEAKLEILHRCLTPEGAKTVMPEYLPGVEEGAEGFPEEYDLERDKLLEEYKLNGSPLDGDNDEWHVEDVVCALANEPLSSSQALPDHKRQVALTMMRDALLENE